MSEQTVDDADRAVVGAALPSAQRRPVLATLAGLNAVAAWAGAVALVAGAIDFGAANARLPFESLVLAGVSLAVVVAVPLTALAFSAWTARARTDDLALIAGVLLIGWILVQTAVLRTFSWFQPAYLCLGAYFVAASDRIHLGRHVTGMLRVAIGAVLAAVGLGLLPHLIKTGLTVTSVLSVILLVGGIVAVTAGARTALQGRRLPGKVGGSLAALVVLVVAVSIISPAVAATNVPATEVGRTPEAVGLQHQSVTLRTTDGVRLGAWYVPGDNGAGVVMLHGAGSTRSSVLDQAAALVESGYSVLMVDARGHGESDGVAMDFGWFGDPDIAAGTEYLASRPAIDADRIGVVGFSMGGEEAIGAAATDPRIRAVVAEGATARQAADKAWLSDTYGWRGWIQERLEAAQYGVTDYLTDASPPVSLRSAVGRASETHFLLIAAGNVDDESAAASYIESGASDRVVVWDVEGAGHTGGFDTDADDWGERVVGFLDERLS